MKRRDLIKLGIAASCAGLTKTFAGQEDTSLKDLSNLKQTEVYNFSTPLILNFAVIDKLYRFNQKYKKSRIKSLYTNIPAPLADILGDEFQSLRSYDENIKTFKDFAKYVKYAQDLGFHFIYVLNSPKPFSEHRFLEREKGLKKLLHELKKMNCTEIKVANTQLLDYLSQNTDFDLSASTSFEFHNISQYKNLLTTYPNIKNINVSIDDNRNFTFLKNLKKSFPKVNFEIIVNEECIHGCPAKMSHNSSLYSIWPCMELRKKDPVAYFFKTNMIYPWWLPHYTNIGINKFKHIAFRCPTEELNDIEHYLDCIEYGYENLTANDFFNKIFPWDLKFPEDLKLTDIMENFPDINHFEKYGDKCANICDSTCTYCLKCADKVRKFLV